MVIIRRIVTYKIFINKQLKHTNVTIRLALYIHIVVLSNLGSSHAMLASDVWIEMLAILTHENGIRCSVPLVRCLPKMLPSSSTHTGSQIATWRRSLTWTWTRHDSTSISDYRRRERCSSDHRRFFLNPARHDILPHRQSQLSDLTIRLHITTSLKSIDYITETVTFIT